MKMKEIKLTDKHFCYVLFLEMTPTDFANLLKTNGVVDNLKYLDSKYYTELYEEAKERMVRMNSGQVSFDFDFDSEPFVFNKYINGKLDRLYKICVFEYDTEDDFAGKTSSIYCEGMPLFFDAEGNMIKHSLN